MRPVDRITRICLLLQAWWLKNPDARLGQLLDNLVDTQHPDCCLFQIEDTAWESKLRDALGISA